jgi:hypothetical protein
MMEVEMREGASMANRTPSWRYLIVATLIACALVALVYFLHSDVFVLRGNVGGDMEAVVAPLPAPGAGVDEYRRIAYETGAAARNDWLSLAQMLGTRAWPEDIARGYARYAGEPAVYDACLRGFRSRR